MYQILVHGTTLLHKKLEKLLELILSPGYKFAKQCHVDVVESSSLTLSLVLNTKMGKEAGEVIFYIKPQQNNLNEEWGGTFCISKFYNVCYRK